MRRHVTALVTHAVLIFFSLLFIIPVFWLLVTALKAGSDFGRLGTVWWPDKPQWGNFATATTYVDFWGHLRNSLITSFLFAVPATLTGAFVGYTFARVWAPGRLKLFNFMVMTMLINSLVTLLPTFVLFSKAGLTNTFYPWLLWGLACPAYLAFMFRQFFSGLPAELEEAARLDGCSTFGTFVRIALPLAKPALATAFILAFVGTWGDFVAPLLFLDSEHATLAVSIANDYRDPSDGIMLNVMAAAALLYTLPAIALYIVMQRQIVQGVASTGIK
jgi:multiple sugar transport system permease protein